MFVGRLRALFDAGRQAALAQTQDRRTDPRRKVLLKAMVLPVADYAEMRIVDVSRSGFGGETTAPLQTTRPFTFCMEENQFYQGTVRWVRGQRFGVDLDNALSIMGCSSDIDPGSLASHNARARRYIVDRPGRIALASISYHTTVRDISQCGMRMELEAKLEVGQHVIIRLPDRPLILATVRWCANEMAGLETAERIQTLRLAYGCE